MDHRVGVGTTAIAPYGPGNSSKMRAIHLLEDFSIPLMKALQVDVELPKDSEERVMRCFYMDNVSRAGSVGFISTAVKLGGAG